MYRRAAAQGPLQGVAAGPYTGGRKVVDAGKLTRAAKKRLADCLAGRAEPSPIAYDRRSSLASSVRAVWGAVVAVIVLVLTFARGFDDRTSGWEVQPLHAVAIYLLACGLFSFALLAILRRRFLVGGDALRPGRYLLPLDLVEISPIDARGRQRIVVQPLGDARDCAVRGEGRKAELVITFLDTSHATFALRSDPGGQVTLRRLEHAQRLLEELTYTKDISQSFAHDPFFDLRADASWSSAAASDDDAPMSLRTRRSIVAGKAGPVIAGVLTLALAFGTFGVRNAIARRLVLARELRAERERVAKELAAKRAQEEEEDEKRREEAMKAFAAAHPPKSKATCLASFRKEPYHGDGDILRIVEAILAELDRTGSARVPVVFGRTDAAASHVSAEQWNESERITVDTFARMVAEHCPTKVMRFAREDLSSLPRPKWGVFIDYVVTWPEKTIVPRRGVPRETIAVDLMNVVFDVKLVGPDKSGKATFRLTMPRPERLQMARRAQTLFPSTIEDDGTYDERVYESLTARAFDRLYDELWSLFFTGSPRVPLDRLPTSTHTGADP
jgi:hypothetical protein